MKIDFQKDYNKISDFYVKRNFKQSRFSLISKIIKIYEKESMDQNHPLNMKLKVKTRLFFMSKSRLLEIKFDHLELNGLLLEIFFSKYPVEFKSHIKEYLFLRNEKVLNITLLNFYKQSDLDSSMFLKNLIRDILFIKRDFIKERELFKINENQKNLEEIFISNDLSETKRIRL